MLFTGLFVAKEAQLQGLNYVLKVVGNEQNNKDVKLKIVTVNRSEVFDWSRNSKFKEYTDCLI